MEHNELETKLHFFLQAFRGTIPSMLDGLFGLLHIVCTLHDLSRLANRISRWVNARGKQDEAVSGTGVCSDATPKS